MYEPLGYLLVQPFAFASHAPVQSLYRSHPGIWVESWCEAWHFNAVERAHQKGDKEQRGKNNTNEPKGWLDLDTLVVKWELFVHIIYHCWGVALAKLARSGLQLAVHRAGRQAYTLTGRVRHCRLAGLLLTWQRADQHPHLGWTHDGYRKIFLLCMGSV